MSNKLMDRLTKVEHRLKPSLNWPTFEQFYDSEEDRRAWFEENNPSYDFDEFNKDHKAFQDCYDTTLTNEEIIKRELDFAPVKPGCIKTRDSIVKKYNAEHPIIWMIRAPCFINKV